MPAGNSLSSTISTSAANAAKYFAGTRIDDGYIKSVEKVWVDSYTIAFTNTLTCIQLAEVPANKKILSIDIEIATSISQSSGTISIGYVEDTTDILATTGCGDFMAPLTLTHNNTRTSISLPGGTIPGSTATSSSIALVATLAGFQGVTGGTQTTIGIKLNNWTMTTGTVKSVVRYV